MNPRSRDTVHVRLLRALDWGQIAAYDPDDGEHTRIIEELRISPEHMDEALALADRWTQVKMPSLLVAEQAQVVAAPGGNGRVLRLEMQAPRGLHLAELIAKIGVQDEAMLAGLLVDLASALQSVHGQGLVVGNIAPELLFLCPPGQDDAAALRLFDAGLPALVAMTANSGVQVEDPRFAQIFVCAAVVAPEVLAGQLPGIQADIYAFCATAAFALLRQHPLSADSPSLQRHAANTGIGPEMLQNLLQAAPTLGPLLARGMAAQPWGRAGVLAELLDKMNELLVDRPRTLVHGRSVLAPWAVGSPLIALAAFAANTPYAERFAARSHASSSRIVSAKPPTTLPGSSVVAPQDAEQAKLRAALVRMDIERDRAQKAAEARGRNLLSRLVIIAVFVLLAAAIWAISWRQAHLYDPVQAARDLPSAPPRYPAPKELPKPRVLFQEQQP